jgi:hypothetical protein
LLIGRTIDKKLDDGVPNTGKFREVKMINATPSLFIVNDDNGVWAWSWTPTNKGCVTVSGSVTAYNVGDATKGCVVAYKAY